MNRAVIYARVSSKDQEREGYSIPAQLKLLREFAKREGFTISREFVDIESAKEPGRMQFTEMLRFLKKNPCTILVEKTDRLYRNFTDSLSVEDLGADVRFVKQGLSYGPNSRSSDKFIHNMNVAMARLYIDNLSEEVRKGLNQKASQGVYPGGQVPLGYYRQNGAIRIDPGIASKIERLFALYSTGDFSITDIHREAKKIGLRYPKSGRFASRSEMERMLKKPFYCGMFTWNGAVYSGDHPAMISIELFKGVQAVFTNRNKPGYSKRKFPFSGLMKCGNCGHSITAEIKKGRYVYYHCTGYGGKCKPRYYNQDFLDNGFAGIIKSISIPIELHDWLKECLEWESKTSRIKQSRQRDVLESQKQKIETRQKLAYQEKLEGKISDDFWQSLYQDSQIELSEVNYQLESVNNEPNAGYDMAEKAIELSYRAHSLYLGAKPEDKRRLLKSVLSNCDLKDGTLYPTYKKPFDVLSKGHDPDQWRRGRDSNSGWSFPHNCLAGSCLQPLGHLSPIQSVNYSILRLSIQDNFPSFVYPLIGTRRILK